jgi:Spy/CpxP family protein refolding chaperone|tara:strand:- start:202 stop:777 length:576 start_codon:yes stop_codon:yes gene_type:complete
MKKILILLALTAGLYAQDRGDREAMMKKKMEAGKEQREVWLIATQTTYLDLTSEQAEKFFPLQNEFHKRSEEAKKANSEKLRTLRSAAKDDRSKFDVDAAIDSKVRMKGTLVRLESKFLKDTKGILTEQQRMKLLFFEERMKSNLHKKMSQKDQEGLGAWGKNMRDRKGTPPPPPQDQNGTKRGFDSKRER